MALDDAWADVLPDDASDRVRGAWARSEWDVVADELFALAADHGDPRLIAPIVALDTQLIALPQLAAHTDELAALPRTAVTEAARAFLLALHDPDDERTMSALRSAVSGLRGDDDLLAATLATCAATIFIDRARWAESTWFVEAADAALHRARAAGAPESAIEALWFRMMVPAVMVEWNTFDGTARLDALAEALAVPRARNLLRSHHGPALVAMGQVLAARGEFGAGAVSIARGIPLLPPRSHLRASANARLAHVKYRQGDWQGARSAAELVRDVDVVGAAWTRGLLASVDTLHPATGGDLRTASERVRAAQAVLVEQPSVQGSTMLFHAQLAIVIGRNDWSGMLRLLDDAEEPGYRRIYTDHEWRALRGMALRNLGRHDRYRRLVRSWRDEQSGAEDTAYFWAHTALLAQIDGESDAALVAARRARTTISDGDDPLGRTWVRLVVGTIVSLYGDPTEGMESYEAARGELSAMGARGFEGLCTRIIESTAAQLSRVSGDALATLTAQQRRVAELVTEGFTSAEIAEILYLSKKTIDFHVANILSRLGLPSRRELVRRFGRGSAG
ncbi:helix-turn-helix transcriptional regulator [Microbacterium radiodurans]|uniref:Helix-turn-helix transcriptional regulator n=1 Tax=Microbacterium radiodurans TaxID=661398 RepID=A0A5J5IYQ7_9MICO|nr:helix-turn-helix transcriptional regulator [Microbacterium radiodurans]KAA9089670.1 helix-turn-helix transcriptional regulator [Microbacterium radiodurans]